MKNILTFKDFHINEGNWLKSDTPQLRRKIVRENQKDRDSLKQRIEKDIEDGKDVSNWICGYVINFGGEHGFNTKTHIYSVYPQYKDNLSYVLADSIGGGLHWYNYENHDIMLGDENREEGIRIYNKLKKIKFK